jgi:hypothetical protein
MSAGAHSMPATREQILEAALKLPEEDRFVIASELLGTLPEELPALAWDDPGLAAELERRSGDRDGAVPWEQLRDELRNDS